MTKDNSLIIVGYSGHAFVCLDAALTSGYNLRGYFDNSEKGFNPFNLKYLGSESDVLAQSYFERHDYFIGIGANRIREKVTNGLIEKFNKTPINIIHVTSIVSPSSSLKEGVLCCAGAVVNPLVYVGRSVIINTSASVDHECILGDFCQIAPNATLCGNVTVGARSFIGAGAVVKEGVRIGQDVMVGAGAVIINNVPDDTTIVGNPGRIISKKI